MEDLGFPLWLRITHVSSILFLSLLVRSGIEVLSAHPKLYWNDACRPGTEWLRLTRKRMPEDQLWTSKDEEESFSPWIAMPGRTNLGLGRHWHFAAVLGWVLTGLVYVVLLFLTPQWQRLVPTSWSVIPDAADTALTYLRLEIPPPGHPYNPVQQLSYFGVVFLLSPLAILTGAAMSPALAARFPWFGDLFGGRQAARSIHFPCLAAFVAFTAVHTFMVVVHGLRKGLAAIALGSETASRTTAYAVSTVAVGLIVALHVTGTFASLRRPAAVQHWLGRIVDPPRRVALGRLTSHQEYPPQGHAPFFRVNGRPPRDQSYQTLARNCFADWRLKVTGLVEHPLSLSLDDLRMMERRSQVTKHSCIQGWTAVGAWSGAPVANVLDRCRPLPAARYVVFHAFDDKAEEAAGHGYYYETVELPLARHPQTILAYDMNDAP